MSGPAEEMEYMSKIAKGKEKNAVVWRRGKPRPYTC